MPRFGKRLTTALISGLVLASIGLVRPDTTGPTYTGVSRPSQVRELAFAVRGKISDVLVEPGDRVEPGTELIRLDSAVQQAMLDLAKVQAADDTRLQLAQIGLDFQQKELEIVEQARADGGANEQDVRQARFNVDRARVELKAAEIEGEQRRLTVDREQARLDQMRILSPIAGDVIKVSRHAGETVDELTSVVTIVQIDPLQIDVSVPVPVSRHIAVGDPASVQWQDIETGSPAEGKVIFVSSAGEASVREVLIRIEVPNPELLPSGMHARISFQSEEDTGIQPD
ncbi:MAG TPA: efflux RND transporter periplasmic adaptor subunit [Phycisphaerales bacterium]|nr:efflux RND transporter periplasmic adaptor subunit [Phycisphaerales bacterium]